MLKIVRSDPQLPGWCRVFLDYPVHETHGMFEGTGGWSLAWRTWDKSIANNVSLHLFARCIFTRLPTLKSTSFPTLFPTLFPTRLPTIIAALIPPEKLFGELSL